MFGACELYSLGIKEIIEEADECYKEHTRIINDYINDELHCTEGPHYYQYSIGESLYLWKSYAKLKNLPVTKVIPPRVVESLKYVNCVSSSIDECGSAIFFSDSHAKNFNDHIINFFSREYFWEKGKYFTYNRSKKISDGAGNILANLVLLSYEPEYEEVSEFKDEKYYILVMESVETE